MGFRKEEHRGELPFSSCHITSRGPCLQHAITDDVGLDHLAERGLARLLHYSYFLNSTLHTLHFGSKCTKCSPHRREDMSLLLERVPEATV